MKFKNSQKLDYYYLLVLQMQCLEVFWLINKFFDGMDAAVINLHCFFLQLRFMFGNDIIGLYDKLQETFHDTHARHSNKHTNGSPNLWENTDKWVFILIFNDFNLKWIIMDSKNKHLKTRHLLKTSYIAYLSILKLNSKVG